eukprot:3447844-Amphidinium_carterae.1
MNVAVWRNRNKIISTTLHKVVLKYHNQVENAQKRSDMQISVELSCFMLTNDGVLWHGSQTTCSPSGLQPQKRPHTQRQSAVSRMLTMYKFAHMR